PDLRVDLKAECADRREWTVGDATAEHALLRVGLVDMKVLKVAGDTAKREDMGVSYGPSPRCGELVSDLNVHPPQHRELHGVSSPRVSSWMVVSWRVSSRRVSSR